MSKVFSKLITWFILLVVLVAIISGLRASILDGNAGYDMFVAVFSVFPFAETTAQVVANVFQYQATFKGLMPSNVITDLTKILAMTIVCPGVVGFAMRILLPLPEVDWRDRERIMSGIGYRLKKGLLDVITMPICAGLTFLLVEFLQGSLRRLLPFLFPVVTDLLLLIMVLAISVLYLVICRRFDAAFVWRHRLINNLLGDLIKILVTNFCCFWIALAILNDRIDVILSAGLMLFIAMLGIGLMLDVITGGHGG